MVRLNRWWAPVILVILASCGAPKPAPLPPVTVPPTPAGKLFPVPYFPARQTQIDGHPVGELAPGWTAAGLYTEGQFTSEQKAWVATLEPAGGEGRVAPEFTGDFDGDGKEETVSYGAWARGAEEGNFILVTRPGSNPAEILLLKELRGLPRFTVFTLKPDGSLWFGGGVDAGEVTMNLTWEQGKPVFRHLSRD